jgi:hypothetical protein|tara:strand:- start:87 stop:239 length:153 start_codon:yes stop_codon:yes gene_type:complete
MVKLRETIKEKAMFKQPISIGFIVPCILVGTFLLSIAWIAYSSVSLLVSL